MVANHRSNDAICDVSLKSTLDAWIQKWIPHFVALGLVLVLYTMFIDTNVRDEYLSRVSEKQELGV